jgi:hypothetical protein
MLTHGPYPTPRSTKVKGGKSPDAEPEVEAHAPQPWKIYAAVKMAHGKPSTVRKRRVVGTHRPSSGWVSAVSNDAFATLIGMPVRTECNSSWPCVKERHSVSLARSIVHPPEATACAHARPPEARSGVQEQRSLLSARGHAPSLRHRCRGIVFAHAAITRQASRILTPPV